MEHQWDFWGQGGLAPPCDRKIYCQYQDWLLQMGLLSGLNPPEPFGGQSPDQAGDPRDPGVRGI